MSPARERERMGEQMSNTDAIELPDESQFDEPETYTSEPEGEGVDPNAPKDFTPEASA